MSKATGYPDCMQTLIEEFSKMPGIGVRTAERLAFYILTTNKEATERLSEAVRKVRDTVRYCKDCFNLSENELCRICSDPTRDVHTLCVIEEPKDIIAMEKSGVFRGLYHVLLGALSPLDGVGPDDLKVPELLRRLKEGSVSEVILGTTSDTEGEATAIYLKGRIKTLGIKVTRLAQGIPLGTDLEFADRATLIRAIEARLSY